MNYSPEKDFTNNGFDSYLVELNIIGIKNNVILIVPGENEDGAYNCAMDTITQLKANDCECVGIKNLGR